MANPFRLIFFTSYTPRFWDRLDAENGYDWTRPERYREMTRLLERGGFEAVMFADTLSVSNVFQGKPDVYVKNGIGESIHDDPLPLIAAMSQATQRIGLVATMSTTLFPPKLLAQVASSLDHVMKGRLGWNIVTSMGKEVAKNFGVDDLLSKDERYDMADEFVDLADRIWAEAKEAWAGGEGLPGSADRLHLPPMPQGRPVIMQAGGSERGREFAAKHADMIISHRNSPAAMKDFRDDMRARMSSIGRDPDSCKIFFTIRPYIASSVEEAEAMRAEELALPTSNLETGLANFSSRIGYDVSRLPIDEPLPADLKIAGSDGVLQQHTEKGAPTLREIAMSEIMKDTHLVQGTPEQIADELEAVMEEVGGDGFAIRGTMVPSVVVPLVDQLVPVLQSRGLTRKGYRYPTFRENMADPYFSEDISRGIETAGSRR